MTLENKQNIVYKRPLSRAKFILNESKTSTALILMVVVVFFFIGKTRIRDQFVFEEKREEWIIFKTDNLVS